MLVSERETERACDMRESVRWLPAIDVKNIASRKKALPRSRVRAHFIVATAVPLTHPMRMLMCRRGGWCAVQHCDRGASTTITRLASGGGGRGGGGGRCAAAEKAAVARPSVESGGGSGGPSVALPAREHTHTHNISSCAFAVSGWVRAVARTLARGGGRRTQTAPGRASAARGLGQQ